MKYGKKTIKKTKKFGKKGINSKNIIGNIRK